MSSSRQFYWRITRNILTKFKLKSYYVNSKHLLLCSLVVVPLWIYFSYEPATNTFLDQYYSHSVPTANRKDDQMACHIPKLNPFDASIKQYVSEHVPANCDAHHPLIFTTDLNHTLIQVKNPRDYGYRHCCYKKFRRLDTDFNITENRRCIWIRNQTVVVPSHFEFIKIYCKKLDRPLEDPPVPVDMFNFVPLKSRVEKRVQDWQKQNKPKDRRVNVVILGIDTVSHMNFHRVMPKTLKYITEELNAISMDGYNSVQDGTFPNDLSILSGLTVEELKPICWKDINSTFDSCPLIWKNFSANGYRTAYSEDAVWMAAFNYQKQGFVKPPTDYYNSAFTYHLEKVLGHTNLTNCRMCYGPRLAFQVSLDFLKAMRIRMGSERRYFQFCWTTALTHDYLNLGKLGDELLLQTMKWFKEENRLENTIFILMSDHGIRWGGIRLTIQGMIEERMPFLYFILPEWFREQYRPAVSNLIRNRARLTTPFDFYETLLDLSHLDNIKETTLEKRYISLQGPELPRGISLFLPVPATRTCKDAGIDEHWCVCHSSVTLEDPNVPIIRKAAMEVVRTINKLFDNVPQCALVELDVVFNARVIQAENKAINEGLAQVSSLNDVRLRSQQFTCSVSFSVAPSNATFEATITRHTDGAWKLSGNVSRTNLYGSQSHCVTDYNMKKFCYCL